MMEYIREAESLSSLTNNQTLQESLARAFVNSIANNINQRIVAGLLLTDIYTFQEAKAIVERVYAHSENNFNRDRVVNYLAFMANTNPDPLITLIQIVQTMCNKMSE
jgi:cell division protein YceG involved in septum cleavage